MPLVPGVLPLGLLLLVVTNQELEEFIRQPGQAASHLGLDVDLDQAALTAA